jgi:DNA-binding NarL/FixJ family response regulator
VFVRLAIADPLPIYRRGMQAVLDDLGLPAETFDSQHGDELRAWLEQEERKVVLITLETARDWQLLADVHRQQPSVVLVAVLPDVSVLTFARAVSAGAAAAVRRDAPAEDVREVVQAAVKGLTLLPVEVLRSIVLDRPASGQDTDIPPEQELAWLRQLAQGSTVARIARQAGYSERMMFRLLRDLYTRLGAENRAQALMRAQERGWL